MCKFCLEICYNCGDIEFFSKGLFFIGALRIFYVKKEGAVCVIDLGETHGSCMVSRGSLSQIVINRGDYITTSVISHD